MGYDFFDEFLDVAEEEQMKVIFGTPTATPPVWLTEKYPEVLKQMTLSIHHQLQVVKIKEKYLNLMHIQRSMMQVDRLLDMKR